MRNGVAQPIFPVFDEALNKVACICTPASRTYGYEQRWSKIWSNESAGPWGDARWCRLLVVSHQAGVARLPLVKLPSTEFSSTDPGVTQRPSPGIVQVVEEGKSEKRPAA